MRSFLLAVALLCVSALDATATSTVCSNPSRARVLDRLAVSIPGGNEPAFASIIREFEGVTHMSRAEVTSSDNGGFRERTIIFQSPQVSVAILIDTQRESTIARISVNRTCITDALEDWKPYWKAFRKFLDSKGLKRVEGGH
jgi:hypothetical protein